jgi:hypothetical protein
METSKNNKKQAEPAREDKYRTVLVLSKENIFGSLLAKLPRALTIESSRQDIVEALAAYVAPPVLQAIALRMGNACPPDDHPYQWELRVLHDAYEMAAEEETVGHQNTQESDTSCVKPTPSESVPSHRFDDSHTVMLLKEVYLKMYGASETFREGRLGSDLAYFLGAVVTAQPVSWQDLSNDFRVRFQASFPQDHAAWKFIDSTLDEDDLREIWRTLSVLFDDDDDLDRSLVVSPVIIGYTHALLGFVQQLQGTNAQLKERIDQLESEVSRSR